MGEEIRSIAVVGGGISGISCAYRLQKKYQVTLFEKNERLGGHTNTYVIPSGEDAGLGIDTGFIVLNNKNYPRLHRFLKELKVPVRWSDMSFGFCCEQSGYAYAGKTINSLFAERKNLLSPKFWRMLGGILRFCQNGSKGLKTGEYAQMTLQELIDRLSLPKETVSEYLLPMGAAIWSAPTQEILKFPAEAFLKFFSNHGLLGLRNRPRWQTVVGGSSEYVKAFERQWKGEIVLGEKPSIQSRSNQEVVLRLNSGGLRHFDAVVFACHADEALAAISEPSVRERELLSPWRYQANHVVLHWDETVLPKNVRAWASWNYQREQESFDHVSVTYYMNLLQGLKSKRHYCVSLNRFGSIRKERVIAEFQYTHPVYTRESLNTQKHLQELQGKQRTYFCGSYFGYGFHEDGIRSGELAAEHFGCVSDQPIPEGDWVV